MSACGQELGDSDLQRHHGRCAEARSLRRFICCLQLLLNGFQPPPQPVRAILQANTS